MIHNMRSHCDSECQTGWGAGRPGIGSKEGLQEGQPKSAREEDATQPDSPTAEIRKQDEGTR